MKKRSVSFLLFLFVAFYSFPQRQMEFLDRGLVAVKTSQGVFLSWRLLGTDDLNGNNTSFKLYCETTEIYSGTLTNYLDKSGTTSSTYRIETYIHGVLKESSSSVQPWANVYKSLSLNRPSGGTTPDGVSYTYTPNDCSVGDLDGDGQYEIVVKWDPSNSKDNSQSGYTGNVYLDAYKMDGTQLWRIDLGVNIRAGAHYTQFIVYDLDGDGQAEMVCKTAPGSKDGAGNYVSPGNDNSIDYRNSNGYILSGNEYLTVFRGIDGVAMHTTDYKPVRGTVSAWRDSYGNRVDRFLACVAYLDGKHPSVVMCRGYYTRLTAAAFDYSNGKLKERWMYDSGNTSSTTNLYGQGNHNLSVGDVDGDGKDEIILGSGAIDDNGTMLYRTGLGHGDAMHLADLDPSRPGLEVWDVHEEKGYGKWNYELHDAATGEIIWHSNEYDVDNGRGLAADYTAGNPGFELWSASSPNVYDVHGNVVATSLPNSNGVLYNFRIYWDGDLQDELLDGTKITKGDGTRLLSAWNSGQALAINGSKATPCLQADLFGDWREEVVYYNVTDDVCKLLIYTTTIPSDYRLYTLMHDPIYRLGIAWQNVGYNQPPHLGFYIGEGLDNVPVPNMYTVKSTPLAVNQNISVNDFVCHAALKNGVLKIKSEKQIKSISVYDLSKTLIYDEKVNTSFYSKSLESFAQNVYIVKVKAEQGVKIFKLRE